MEWLNFPVESFLGFILVLSSLGVVFLQKPVHAALSFLLTLLALAALYVQLSASFIGVMQILVYAGAILVLFMFVIILFQDAIIEISKVEPKSLNNFIYAVCALFIFTMAFLGFRLATVNALSTETKPDFGTVESLGKLLYLDFFFPFEAVLLVFLVAIIGALYTAKREI